MSEALAAIVIHDVAPATWPACRTLLTMVDSLGAPPVTLLVVPRFHGGAAVDDAPAFVDAINARSARGDELVLHGYEHRDDAPPPRTPRAFVARRLLTRCEGEFAAISEDDALRRLREGVALFDRHRWPLHGFVPPAWLLGDAARRALDACGHPFEYVPVRGGIHTLPDWTLEPTANVVYSPDRRWRRMLSRAHIALELARHGERRLLRLSLHPLDAHYPEVLAHWRALIIEALRHRRPVTKHAAMAATAYGATVAATPLQPVAADPAKPLPRIPSMPTG